MPQKKFFKTSLQPNSGTIKSAGKPRQPRYLFRREEGQSALEFMLVLPVFVLAFLMVVDLGMLMYQYVSVSNAVREGARFGAVNCGDGSCDTTDLTETVFDRTISRSGGVLDPSASPAEVTVGWFNNNGDLSFQSRGDSVVVKVDYDYNFMFFPGSIPVVSCSDMSLEQGDPAAGLIEAGADCTSW